MKQGNRDTEQLQKNPMPFTLITKKDKIMRFYFKEVADMYQQLEGGSHCD